MTTPKSTGEQRASSFSRNPLLEQLLTELNTSLSIAEETLVSKFESPSFPIVFIMGPMRSGTTLLLQWLADTQIVSYPSNFLSRFYNAPVIGAKIQLMLTSPDYDFRNELGDFSQRVAYVSENGKTQGILAPNEFWYFWRRFLADPSRDDHSDEILARTMDTTTMLRELAGITHVFQKPFACKGMLFNYNIAFLSKLFSNALFIHIHREPMFNMQSTLSARQRQLGSREKWYSFKIPEYQALTELDPIDQVAGQIFYMNNAISNGLTSVSDSRKITIKYEDFCKRPEMLFRELTTKLSNLGYPIKTGYTGPAFFEASETWRGSESDAILFKNAYAKFAENQKD